MLSCVRIPHGDGFDELLTVEIQPSDANSKGIDRISRLPPGILRLQFLTVNQKYLKGLVASAVLGNAAVCLAAEIPSQSPEWKLPPDAPLLTKWSREVGPDNALPEYPRPQMERTEWQNLNGVWDYS